MIGKEWAAQQTSTDAARIQEAIESSTPLRLAEPELTLRELSDCIGQLTMTCESLRRDIVAIEQRTQPKPRTLSYRLRSWIVERLAKQLLAEVS